jgi:hypothetical protein
MQTEILLHMKRLGYGTTNLTTDKKFVTVGSFEGDHDCCYQIACLDKRDVSELIADLTELHTQMEGTDGDE